MINCEILIQIYFVYAKREFELWLGVAKPHCIHLLLFTQSCSFKFWRAKLLLNSFLLANDNSSYVPVK